MEHDVFIFKTSLVEEKNGRQSSPYSKRPYAIAHCFQINNFLETNFTFTGFYFKLENVERSKRRCFQLTFTFIEKCIVFS